jgi:DNA-binding IclR family transcriptional regulator
MRKGATARRTRSTIPPTLDVARDRAWAVNLCESRPDVAPAGAPIRGRTGESSSI